MEFNTSFRRLKKASCTDRSHWDGPIAYRDWRKKAMAPAPANSRRAAAIRTAGQTDLFFIRHFLSGYLFNYRYTYDFEDITRARSIETSFEDVGIGYIEDEDYYYISLKSPMIFNNNNNLTSLTVNLSFGNDAVILSNNADTVSGNTYTWQLNPSNLKDIDITYKFLHLTDPDPEPESPEENNPGNSDNEQNEDVSNWVNDNKLLVFGGVFVILVCVIIIISVIKSKKL